MLMPPPDIGLSDWAEAHYYLSAEVAATSGRWRTLPYQRGIMDALSDPHIEAVTLQKSARVGGTEILKAYAAYRIVVYPCAMLIAQPTVEDAEKFSKTDIAAMIRDCPNVGAVIGEQKARSSGTTILHKLFAGGVLDLVGATSPRGFRRVGRQVIMLDEVDGYPASAGAEGDPVRLAIQRTKFYWDRKIFCLSTPTIAGASRIEHRFAEGDQRRYYVPCPQCGHMDYLVFAEPVQGNQGHWMTWPEGKPDEAVFICNKNGCIIEERHKRSMLENGEWRAHAEAPGHASFHIWAAYSVAPHATWTHIAHEYEVAKAEGPTAMQTWVNTTQGEPWQQQGEAPDYERLFARRESYPIGSVPEPVKFLTAGVDVQKDRWVYEVVGWDVTRENWSIDAGIILGNPANADDWAAVDELLARQYQGKPIARLAIDTGGHWTQETYAWARRHARTVMACKGMSRPSMIGVPSKVDVTIRGKRYRNGCKLWGLGEGVAKGELYGWLGLEVPNDGEPYPRGFCHFPGYDKEFFRQLTAEHLVTRRLPSGLPKQRWELLPGRENHYLDTRVLARVAAEAFGLSRMSANVEARRAKRKTQEPDPQPTGAETSQPTPQSAPPATPPQRQESRPKKRRSRGSGWLSRRGKTGWF